MNELNNEWKKYGNKQAYIIKALKTDGKTDFYLYNNGTLENKQNGISKKIRPPSVDNLLASTGYKNIEITTVGLSWIKGKNKFIKY